MGYTSTNSGTQPTIFKNCVNYGDVSCSGNGEDSSFGGIAGYIKSGSLTNCLTSGLLSCNINTYGNVVGKHTKYSSIQGSLNNMFFFFCSGFFLN